MVALVSHNLIDFVHRIRYPCRSITIDSKLIIIYRLKLSRISMYLSVPFTDLQPLSTDGTTRTKSNMLYGSTSRLVFNGRKIVWNAWFITALFESLIYNLSFIRLQSKISYSLLGQIFT